MNDFAARRDDWKAREELAERMIPLIGGLNRDRDVVTSLHGHRLLGLSTTEILEVHERVAALGHDELALEDTLAVLEALRELAPSAASLDVGRLVEKVEGDDAPFSSGCAPGSPRRSAGVPAEPTDVVLYGFGRIGRLLARILIAHRRRQRAAPACDRRAQGRRERPRQARSLLLRDSVHGRFEGSVDVDEENSQLIANGTRSRSSTPTTRRRSTTPPTASTTRSSSTTPAAGATRPQPPPGVDRRGTRAAHRAGQGRAEEHRARHQPRHHRGRRPDPLAASARPTRSRRC
jgi:hypothetical protein